MTLVHYDKQTDGINPKEEWIFQYAMTKTPMCNKAGCGCNSKSNRKLQVLNTTGEQLRLTLRWQGTVAQVTVTKQRHFQKKTVSVSTEFMK